MDNEQRISAATAQIKATLEGSTMLMFQYALPEMTDMFMTTEGSDQDLGRAVIMAHSALLLFSAASSVALCAVIDARDEPSDENLTILDGFMAQLEGAYKKAAEVDEQLTGLEEGDA